MKEKRKNNSRNLSQKYFFPKSCQFCKKKVDEIDYKDTDLLSHFVTDLGKIKSAKKTGNCSLHQRKLKKAVKRARQLGLLAYTER